jgi:phosphoribosylformylglycinamidine synthase II
MRDTSSAVAPLPGDPAISAELIEEHGLTPEEYAHVCEILGRTPSYTELGVFSVMWSEHCSYKNSRALLKTLPTDGPNILIRAGEENAGVVDIGDGWAVSFKVESHNHPSAVEPFQGAATGVGGILRDIFTMGARPVINMNSLRFGRPDSAEVRHLVDGVVGGIAFYGNCMGIPTIGGDVYFDETYETNCLVNAFSLGVMRHDELQRGCATGAGNPVFYVGAATGRDGIHGATFASVELSEDSESKRSSVQVADPFMEKLLLEACLELFQTDYVVGIQDMGAAGLTCSTCETASRGGSGVEIDVGLVPQREQGMIPYEILLSESQERMLVIVRKGCEEQVQAIFEKWDLHAARIGQVTDDGLMRVRWNGTCVAEIPAKKIADDAPLYHPPRCEPAYISRTRAWTPDGLPEPDDLGGVLLDLLAEPTIASKQVVYRRYDHMVRTGTVVLPGSDAAVFWLREADKYLALSADCNGRYCYLDPFGGAAIAVAESARNIVCAGGRPLALTDCLNFGNPLKPEIYWQFAGCIEGMGAACRAFGTPVTGGNVSFYNENPNGAIDPTPLVVMVGQMDEAAHITTQWFKRAGDVIVLLDGEQADALHGLGGSEYIRRVHGLKTGAAPAMDLAREKALQDCCLEAIRGGIIRSAHDCSEGGLAVALAECCISAPHDRLSSATDAVGATVDVAELGECGRDDTLLFGEQQSRIIVSVTAADLGALHACAERSKVSAKVLGTAGGTTLAITRGSEQILSVSVDDLRTAWHEGLPAALGMHDGVEATG